jgi:hypothetical protein
MVKAGFDEGANKGIHKTDKLMIKEAIREEATRKNGVVKVAAPGGNIVREGHVRFLMGLARERRAVIKQRVRAGMDCKLIEKPVTIAAFFNEASNQRMRRSQARDLAFETSGKEVGKGSLNFSLDMRRKKREPNAQRIVVTKSVEGRNITTIVLSVLNNTVPPGRKIGESMSIEGRKVLEEVLLLLYVKATRRKIGQEEFTIHVDGVGANRMMNQGTMVRTWSDPRNDGTRTNINDHVVRIMDVALEILPGGASTKFRERRTLIQERFKAKGIGEPDTLSRIPGRIRDGSTSSRRRSRRSSGSSSRRSRASGR